SVFALVGDSTITSCFAMCQDYLIRGNIRGPDSRTLYGMAPARQGTAARIRRPAASCPDPFATLQHSMESECSRWGSSVGSLLRSSPAGRQGSTLEHFITSFILRHGYEAVFVLMVLESACIPVPSEVTMLFGGALANATFVATVAGANHHLNFVLVGLMGTLGNLVGSLIAYAVGRAGGRPLIDRWGRYILLRPHEIDRAESWFDHHGTAAVFFS